ncbi:MAG: hypothetical protein LYZ70_06110 [Nitrososphaerales archaeon]|nr:hypothetical protein [Nitrososphaerales archaeon]
MSESLLPTYQVIDIGGLLLLAFVTAAMVWRIRSGSIDFPRLGKARAAAADGATAKPRFLTQAISVLLLDVGASRPLRTCRTAKWSSHILIFWGFVFTVVATTLAVFMKPEGAVLPLDHPVKLFGNAGGVLLVVGCSAMFYARYQESGSVWHLSRSDYFLVALLFTAASGFLTEDAIYAFGRVSSITPFVYWTHMAIIVALLATAPYTKFTHAFYKPTWLLYQRLTGEPVLPGVESPYPMQPLAGTASGFRALDQEGN